MTIAKGSRVRLTEDARSRFPDIGTRTGVVRWVENFAVVEWQRIDGDIRVPAADLEPVE